MAPLVAALAAKPYKRETIRKTRTALSQILDFYDVAPNVARDERVKLPKERKAHIPPPLAEHFERVAGTVVREYVLPLRIEAVFAASDPCRGRGVLDRLE